MLRIEHQGKTHTALTPWEWQDERDEADEQKRALMDEIVRHGTLLTEDGQPLAEAAARRVRSRMLGEFNHLPDPAGVGMRQHRGPRRWFVERLWPWGTIPMLGGQPKAGKSTVVVDLIASIVQPERRFLDHFEVPPLTDEHLGGVWLINAETPPDDLDRALVDQGVTLRDPVDVDHLEVLGGAQQFDLTDPDVYDLWANRLVGCNDCDGTDDWVPAVVIVDGLTAILAAAGKGTDQYGLWYAAFRRLMRELDVPNALVVGHSTLAGSHLMGGVEAQAGADGLWNLSSADPDNPTATRRFGVVPRMGGRPLRPTPLDLVDGRLRLRTATDDRTPTGMSVSRPEPSPAATDTASSASPSPEQLVLEYVAACNAHGHGPSARQTREEVACRNEQVDRAVRDLVEAGRLVVRPRAGRGGGKALWLP